jgi:hypothetical protein
LTMRRAARSTVRATNHCEDGLMQAALSGV